MVLSLLIEEDNAESCFSNRIRRYALTATGKPLLVIILINSLISTIIHLHFLYYPSSFEIKRSSFLKIVFLLFNAHEYSILFNLAYSLTEGFDEAEILLLKNK